MKISVQLWSYFRDLTGVSVDEFEVAPDATVSELLDAVFAKHPKLAPLRASTLVAVGVEYAPSSQRLCPGDDVSLFPPVQGG